MVHKAGLVEMELTQLKDFLTMILHLGVALAALVVMLVAELMVQQVEKVAAYVLKLTNIVVVLKLTVEAVKGETVATVAAGVKVVLGAQAVGVVTAKLMPMVDRVVQVEEEVMEVEEAKEEMAVSSFSTIRKTLVEAVLLYGMLKEAREPREA